MEREYRWENRRDWGEGPWTSEPDKVQWVDDETGLDCLMVRNETMGHWCGYVGVADEHPDFGKEYDNVDVEVHGGLTFADLCHESKNGHGHGVCHLPFEGRPDKVWWLGFDCAHHMDEAPYTIKAHEPGGLLADLGRCGVYRTAEYVKQEVRQLAQQLKARAA